MHSRTALAAATLFLLAALVPVASAQAAAGTVPPFTVGTDRLYAHSSADSLSVWMNALAADGAEAPYYLNGAGVADPTGTVAVNPVAQQDFEARIALTPALTQALTLTGTVTVQAYIGGGSFTGGVADIATSLAVDGTEVGKGASQQHVMTPKNGNAPQAGTTYDPISWTFTLANVAVPAGAKLEWVISGTVQAGNNIFLSTYPGRGSSYVELPVAAASAAPTGATVTHFYRTLSGQNATLQFTSTNATNESFRYNWTAGPATLAVGLTGNATTGAAQLRILLDGQVKLNRTVTGHASLAETVSGGSGNWTVLVDLSNFTGALTLKLAPPPAATATMTGSGTHPATATSSRTTPVPSTSTTKGSPGPATPLLLGALAVGVLLARRRAA